MKPLAAAALLLALAPLSAAAETVPVPQRRPAAAPVEAAPSAQRKLSPAPVESAPSAPAAFTPDATPPGKLRWSACPALMSGAVTGRIGEPVAEGECGIDSPVLVIAIGGVKLSAEATMTCSMASALAVYVPKVDAAAHEIIGSGLASLLTGSGYECRKRNRAASGKLSQHAFANALDITAFSLANGATVSVETDWPQPPNAGKQGPPVAQRATTPQARFLAAAHAAACPLFTTVLGPDADAEHRDNMHLDLGCHGRDCRFVICQ